MKKKVLIILSIIFTSFSCSQSESYLLATQSRMRIIEREDHQKCVEWGIDFGDWKDVTTELYWRCRHNAAENRIIHDATTADAIRNNAIIKEITDEILRNLAHANEAVIGRIGDNIETLDHSICIKKGYNLDSFDEAEITAYYKCRQKLITDRTPATPKITHSYEMAILPPKRAQQYSQSLKEIQEESSQQVTLINQMAIKYPICAGLNINSADFKKCAYFQDESQKCLADVETVKAKKQLEDKIYCQQQSYIQFPDNYSIAQYKSESEIARMSKNKNDNNNNQQDATNNVLQFLDGDDKTRNIGKSNLNNQDEYDMKNGLYSKIELSKLRERFINKCNKLMEEKLPFFVEKSAKTCFQIGIDWDKNKN